MIFIPCLLFVVTTLLSRCNTNDCNTMDPRISAGASQEPDYAEALAPTLTLIVAAIAVISTNL